MPCEDEMSASTVASDSESWEVEDIDAAVQAAGVPGLQLMPAPCEADQPPDTNVDSAAQLLSCRSTPSHSDSMQCPPPVPPPPVVPPLAFVPATAFEFCPLVAPRFNADGFYSAPPCDQAETAALRREWLVETVTLSADNLPVCGDRAPCDA